MSWATCYSASNNIHFDSPPIMADGRNYSNWQPDAVINHRIQQQEGITSNWNYRQFLQHNGQQIINYNSLQAYNDLGLDPYFNTPNNKNPSDNVPYLFKSTFDNSSPGYGYPNSDLKNPYLTREQLNSRMISPSIQLSK